jgi:hypothetical protein
VLDEAWDYYWYADRFGWTPDQVEAMPAWLDGPFATIAREVDRAQERANRRAAQEAERG